MKRALSILASTGLLIACGGRPDAWNDEAKLPLQSLGLKGSVAVLDPSLERVLMLSANAEQEISATAVPVGKDPALMKASEDGSTLFILSDGEVPRRRADDELPSLTVIDGDGSIEARARWEFADRLRDMTIDPLGEWVVLHGADGIISNPNQLILIRTNEPGSAPISKTIRSFGGRPQRLSFTPMLTVPQGKARRFLVVETDHEVSLVDLLEPERPEVTILLPKRANGVSERPAEVIANDGDPDDPNDARIAIRLANSSDVIIVELSPSQTEDKRFQATINITDVGGTPSSIAFLRTDGGLRLAALVPDKRIAALIDPETTVVETVNLAEPYDGISLVTENIQAKPILSDVALLYSQRSPRLAFWSLGKATGTPYRSIDAYDIGAPVTAISDVPGEEHAHLKLLETSSRSQFFVLDLEARQSFPMVANLDAFELLVALDGARAWAYHKGAPELARIGLRDLNPTSLYVERPIDAVWDVARADGGRSLIALHANSADGHASLGATVLDALSPDMARSRFHAGLLLRGLQ